MITREGMVIQECLWLMTRIEEVCVNFMKGRNENNFKIYGGVNRKHMVYVAAPLLMLFRCFKIYLDYKLKN
jgi:hypothetical protein